MAGPQSAIPAPRQAIVSGDPKSLPDTSWWRYWRDPILGSIGFIGGTSSSGTGGITITVTSEQNPSLLLTVPGTGAVKASIGASAAYGGVVVTQGTNFTATSNAGSTATDLMSTSLPASSMSATGKGVRITGWGTMLSNASTKTLGVVFGGTTLLSTTLPITTTGPWKTVVEVFRTGASTQVSMATALTNASSGVSQVGMVSSTAPENTAGAITIKHVGTGQASGDITQRGQLVEFFN